MSEEQPNPVDDFVTCGSMLKAARSAQGITEREAEDRLNWMPGYVGIIERDNFQGLRSPAFARGYVKAYGRLLQLDENRLLAAFDHLRDSAELSGQTRIETRPLQLQHTGIGVVVGIAVLLLLVLALWWWQGAAEGTGKTAVSGAIEPESVAPTELTTGDSVEPQADQRRPGNTDQAGER